MNHSPKRILILGAGFSGLYAYLELHKIFHRQPSSIDINLVSDKDYFLFVPMIHEVATGTLTPSSITQPIRTIPQCCLKRFIQGRVESINLDKHQVQIRSLPEPVGLTHDTQPLLTIGYDYLIMGMGSISRFADVPGAREFSLVLKNLKDAKQIKNRIINNFERAQYETDKERQALLNFVIIGGGATGVELAGEISDLIRYELTTAFPRLAPEARVIVLHNTRRLIQHTGTWFGKQAKSILENKKNVIIRCNVKVTKVVSEGIFIDDEFIPTHAAIWTAGVEANPIILSSAQAVAREEKTQRIIVNKYLQLPNHPESFVVGDQACVLDKDTQQPYPMRAQFAVRQGQVSAHNIKHLIKKDPLTEFHWKDQGLIMSLGKGGALAQTGRFKFSGLFAWWLYRTIYLTKLIGIRMKLRTTLEWTTNLFTSRDISKF